MAVDYTADKDDVKIVVTKQLYFPCENVFDKLKEIVSFFISKLSLANSQDLMVDMIECSLFHDQFKITACCWWKNVSS